MTWLRRLTALLAVLPLSGCFLESEAPRFGDAEAVALLGSETTTFAHFDRDAGEWKRSDLPLIQMIPEGNHYRLHDPSAPNDPENDLPVHVVGLDPDHWLLQVTSPDVGSGSHTYYTVATWNGVDLLLTAITCDDLEGRPGITDHVAFDEDNCTLLPQPQGEPPEFPALLWQGLPPPDKKLVRQP